jgi:hypothetical protein
MPGLFLGGSTLGSLPDPTPPVDLEPTRKMKETKFRTPQGFIRTIRLYDQYSTDDLVINMSKAFLFALSNDKVYDRPQTPWALRRSLCRVGLVF